MTLFRLTARAMVEPCELMSLAPRPITQCPINPHFDESVLRLRPALAVHNATYYSSFACLGGIRLSSAVLIAIMSPQPYPWQKSRRRHEDALAADEAFALTVDTLVKV